MNSSTDPHHNEYLAAMAGMPEHTPSPVPECRLPSIGDHVNGMSGGKHWSGRVQQVEPGRVVVEIDGAWIAVPPEHISRT
jgi:hypothetical protein